MGYVDTSEHPHIVSVSLWSGDEYLSGLRLPAPAAQRLAEKWTGEPSTCDRVRRAYIADGIRTWRYGPQRTITALGDWP